MSNDTSVGSGEIFQLPQPGAHIANFRAAFVNMKVDKTGALVMTFRTPPGHKYDAMPVTDFPGTLLDVQVRRARIMYSEAIEAELRLLGVIPADEFGPDIDDVEGDGDNDGT